MVSVTAIYGVHVSPALRSLFPLSVPTLFQLSVPTLCPHVSPPAACLAGNLPAVSVMLEDIGIDVHVKDERGPTPLHLAVAEGHLAVAQYLVDNSDTSILAQDNEGATPLQVAEAEASRLAADRHAKALRVQSCVNFLR